MSFTNKKCLIDINDSLVGTGTLQGQLYHRKTTLGTSFSTPYTSVTTEHSHWHHADLARTTRTRLNRCDIKHGDEYGRTWTYYIAQTWKNSNLSRMKIWKTTPQLISHSSKPSLRYNSTTCARWFDRPYRCNIPRRRSMRHLLHRRPF